MKTNRTILKYGIFFAFLVLIFTHLLSKAMAFTFPAAGWHRGDVSVFQENSKLAILQAFSSGVPHVEVDIIDFVNSDGQRVGLLAHETSMERTTGKEGTFAHYPSARRLPLNITNSELAAAPFMTLVDFFELVQAKKAEGVKLNISLDLKEDSKTGHAFGQWVGQRIQHYGLQDTVFASSFYKSNILGMQSTCPECLIGGVVFDDHFALGFLDTHYTSLDISGCYWTFFIGFLCKEKVKHDFVLLQDDIFFADPSLVEYWKNQRQVKFVGVFVYKKDRPYTKAEWQLLQKVDWLELDTIQMQDYIDCFNNDECRVK